MRWHRLEFHVLFQGGCNNTNGTNGASSTALMELVVLREIHNKYRQHTQIGNTYEKLTETIRNKYEQQFGINTNT
jgi:hypothetical protein